MKYKNGDKVRVKKDLTAGKWYYMDDRKKQNVVTPPMADLAGKVVTIQCRKGEDQYRVRGDEYHYRWVDGMFEGLEKHEPIIIYQKDDKTVIALDKSTGEEAKAVCSDDDEFSFYEGARIAFRRLKQDRKFSIGDKVIGNERADFYGITTKGWVGEVIRYGRFNDGIVVRSISDDDDHEYVVDEERFDLYKEDEQPKVKPWCAVDTEDMRRELVKFCQGRGCFDCAFCSLNCGFSGMGDDELRLAYALAKQVHGDKE